MNYFEEFKANPTLKAAFWEIPVSFIYVILLYIIAKTTSYSSINDFLASFLFFSITWFLEVKLFSFTSKVHILPIVSFVESLIKEDFSIFIYRLPGQILGSAMAVLIIFSEIQRNEWTPLEFHFLPIDPLLIGVFTGFVAQIIYFLYYFLIYGFKKLNQIIRLVLFAISLGTVFPIVNQIGNISLLNPFGILFNSLLNGHPVSLTIFLIGSVIHVVVPMLFIVGTHYFLKSFVLEKK